MKKFLKKIYDVIFNRLKRRPVRFLILKIRIAERVGIIKKRSLYAKTKWTEEQKKSFDSFWTDVYGKRISDKWHRLYESINGVFAIDYIPEIIYTTKIEPRLNDPCYAEILENKSMVELLTSNSDVVVPETVIVCDAGRYFDKCRRPIAQHEAERLIAEQRDVVIKPTVDSSSGKNVYIFDDGNELLPLGKKYGQDFIVQKKISQHPAFAAFNDESVNTIRIITYVIEGRIYHMPICFRMGRRGSKVDNIHSGGIVVGVNDDGSLLPVGFELGYGDKNQKYKSHPDSEIVFENAVLPYIDKIISAAESLHGRLPHIGIVSWDFTVNSDNAVVLIETNLSAQSIWFPQIVHGKSAFGDNLKAVLDEIRKG